MPHVNGQRVKTNRNKANKQSAMVKALRGGRKTSASTQGGGSIGGGTSG